MFKGKPNAVGWLVAEVSGTRQTWDEAQIRSIARRLGYDLCKILVSGPGTDIAKSLGQLKATVTRLDAESVIVPSAGHFATGQVPADLVRVVDVTTVEPLHTWARRTDGTLPEGYE